MSTAPGTLSRQVAVESAPPPAPAGRAWLWLIPAAGLLGLLLWAYWGVIEPLVDDWRFDENYSVGQLVPPAALWLIWRERRRLRRCAVRPSGWGAVLLLAGQAVRLAGMLDVRESLERYSLVLTIWGLVLLIAGAQVFRRLAWVMLFLLLMLPLPGAVHNRVSNPLQAQATAGAVVLLELSGVTVTRQGNVMLLNDNVTVAVAEACSGLRMLTAFIVVAAVLAYIVDRPRWQKLLLLLSSVPVAIACNLLRLFLTAQLYIRTDSQTAERFFHDFAGLVMMPIAVGLLMGELWVFSRLVTPDNPSPGAATKPAHRLGRPKQPVG